MDVFLLTPLTSGLNFTLPAHLHQPISRLKQTSNNQSVLASYYFYFLNYRLGATFSGFQLGFCFKTALPGFEFITLLFLMIWML
jgi:hypothetical protein